MYRIFYLGIFSILLIGCSNPLETLTYRDAVTIQFSIPERAPVKLIIENSYDKVVYSYSDCLAAGSYMHEITISQWSEGLYFYTLTVFDNKGKVKYKSSRHMLFINTH